MTPAEQRAKRAGVPVTVAQSLHSAAVNADQPFSLFLAVCEAESGFRNVWGHDAGKWRADGTMTKAQVRQYFAQPPGRRPNGAGPMQITSSFLQHEAERRGGLHDQATTIHVGCEFLASLVERLGLHAGVRSYNGSGPNAERYADHVLARRRHWHDVVTS